MHSDGWTYRQEKVRCGKSRCRSCPHGPYWYRYKWTDKQKVKKEYVGRNLPEEVTRECGEKVSVDPRDAIFNRAEASIELAKSILGITGKPDYASARRTFLKLTMIHHPDRGGDHHEMALVSASWAWMKYIYDWEK